MMTRLIIPFGILSIFLLVSCEKASKKTTSKTDAAILTEIDVSKSLEQTSFLDKIDSVVYIPLETDSNYYIGNCSKIFCYDNKVYLLDRALSSVNVFDLKGHHLFSVGKIGSGPGEYLRLDDFAVDSLDKSLLLWSNDNMAMFKYDLATGDFLEKKQMPFFASYFGLLNNDYVFYTDYNVQENSDNKNLIISDREGNVKDSHFWFPTDRMTTAFSFTGFLLSNEEGYLYAYGLSDTVYQITKDSKIYPKYHFNLGSNSWTKHFGIFDHEAFTSKGTNFSLLFNPVFERLNYVFFTYVQDRNIKKGFINTNTDEIYTSDSFSNDLDFELFNIPVGMKNHDTFISIIYPEKVYSLKAKNPEFDNEMLKKSPALSNVLKEIKDEDNPILMIYKMKRDKRQKL